MGDLVHYFVLICRKCNLPMNNNRSEKGVIVIGCSECGIEVNKEERVMDKDDFIDTHLTQYGQPIKEDDDEDDYSPEEEDFFASGGDH